MASWNWPGSRWWECDLHVHTNSSPDITDGGASCADVMASAAARGLTVLGVTDHNTGDGLPAAQAAAAEEGNLVVLPGVELNVEGVHLVVLFGPDKSKDDITLFLGACGITGPALGSHEACATCTVPDALRIAAEHNAVTIGAHIDDTKGILTAIPQGQTLMRVVRDERLLGGETVSGDANLLAFVDNSKGDYRRRFGPLPLVESSDAHRHEDVGSKTTWVKMSAPSVEGLRLAFQDGELSVRRRSCAAGDPNAHARLVIESITVTDSKLMGRGGTFTLRLNPWFNAVIGGRGTGKSTLVEMARLALNRERELPPTIRPEFDSMVRIPGARGEAGLLLEETRIEVVYRKDGDRYRVLWEAGQRSIYREADDGSWEPTEGDIVQRFPVQLFSQKQIFEIARNPTALLDMVNEAISEELLDYGLELDTAQRDFLKARREYLDLCESIGVEGKLMGECEDVTRRIAVYEESEHAAVRTEYRRRVQQESAVDGFRGELDGIAAAIGDLAAALSAPDVDATVFDSEDPVDASVIAEIETTRAKCVQLRTSLDLLAEEAGAIGPAFTSAVEGLPAYVGRLDAARNAHDALKAKLREEAHGGFDDYDALVERKSELADAIHGIELLKPTVSQAKSDLESTAERVVSARSDETTQRVEFIDGAVGSSAHIRIEVVPYGSVSSAENSLRKIIGRVDGGFDRDLKAVLDELYCGYGAEPPDAVQVADFELRLEAARRRLLDLTCGNSAGHTVRDARFATHLSALGDEACAAIELWAPDDSLRVSYSPNGDGQDFKPLEHGSPGQKTAALLAFILSYGDSPILLDQPEDDLENRLIYELVVRRIREVKGHRQITVVTHDANIVVNGDAEHVAVFDFVGGRATMAEQGGLQEQGVRDAVCEVLEGGRQAFEERYRRIGDGTD